MTTPAPAPVKRHVVFALPGLHARARGAEVAFEAVSSRLANHPEWKVTVIGSGPAREGTPYTYIRTGAIPRERFVRWPKLPVFRNEYRYEEISFLPGLISKLRSLRAHFTVTCSYPFVSWAMRACVKAPHIFVTQNGDWPAQRQGAEYRMFSCDGLVCTNPEYFERHQAIWKSVLIPNGVDCSRFTVQSKASRKRWNIPQEARLVVMASALIDSKYVEDGIRAVAALRQPAWLLLAGDGPLADRVDALGRELLGERYLRVTLQPQEMADFYAAGDVFLHMSRSEAFGNVYVEALSCGLPIVAHDTPTTRWILQDAAFLADTSSREATSAALETALNASPDLYEVRHRNAAERFSWDAIANQYSDFLRTWRK